MGSGSRAAGPRDNQSGNDGAADSSGRNEPVIDKLFPA